MTQTLSKMIVVRKQAAHKRLFSLLGYNLIPRRTRAKDGTELREKVGNQMDEARGNLGGVTENDVMCVWRMIPAEEFAYSRCNVNGVLEGFKKDDLYFKKRWQ